MTDKEQKLSTENSILRTTVRELKEIIEILKKEIKKVKIANKVKK